MATMKNVKPQSLMGSKDMMFLLRVEEVFTDSAHAVIVGGEGASVMAGGGMKLTPKDLKDFEVFTQNMEAQYRAMTKNVVLTESDVNKGDYVRFRAPSGDNVFRVNGRGYAVGEKYSFKICNVLPDLIKMSEAEAFQFRMEA